MGEAIKTRRTSSQELTHYYWEGEEFSSATGGWVTGIVGSEASLSKESDHLFASANGQNADFEQRMALWVTDNLIDLTEINILYIEWENTGDTVDSNRSYFIAGGTKNGNTGSFDVRLEKLNTFNKTIETIDVSALTGNYYIRCGCRDSSSVVNSNAQVKIYKIYGI